MNKQMKAAVIASSFAPLWEDAPDPEVELLTALADCPVIRVSSLLGCRRKAHFQTWHDSPPRGASDSWPLIKGSVFHAGIAATMPQQGREQRLQQRIQVGDTAVIVTGKPDLIQPTATGAAIVDYKTTGGMLPKQPRDSHLLQLQIYAWLLQATLGTDTFTGRLVYLNGNGLVAYDFDLVPMGENEIAALAAPLLSPHEADALADPVLGDWECNYCSAVTCSRHPQSPEHVSVEIDMPVHDQPASFGTAEGMPVLPPETTPTIVLEDQYVPF
jgi:hypothetical protein